MTVKLNLIRLNVKFALFINTAQELLLIADNNYVYIKVFLQLNKLYTLL